MDRRKALKHIGVGAAASIYSSSMFSLLQSCKSNAENNVAWKPKFLNHNQASTLEQVLDVILPKTESPGALELGIPEFLDLFLTNVSKKEDQDRFKEANKKFDAAFKALTNKEVTKGKQEDFLAIVDKNFGENPNQDEALEYLQIVRNMGMNAWKNTKQVGEEFFWYDPVPGKWESCRPLDAEGDGYLSIL